MRYIERGLAEPIPFLGVWQQYIRFAREARESVMRVYQMNAYTADIDLRDLCLVAFSSATLFVTDVCPYTDEEISAVGTEISLPVAAADEDGRIVAYCCVWYHEKTDYAYIEPVCTVPAFPGKGIAKAVVYEALRRALMLGARRVYVISDQTFYEKLGFEKMLQYHFYWKNDKRG